MKIVHVASEAFPYIKTGGLADAVGALGGALADAGHEVSVFLPGYRAAVEHPLAGAAERRLQLRVEMGDVFMSGDVRAFSPRKNLTVYFVCREEFFDRRHPYGTPERDYEDNHHRFIFFCKGVVETLRLADLRADIVHAHDWQAALLPLLLRHAEQRHGATLAMKTVFTVHNLAFQGVFPMRSFYRTNLPGVLMGIDGLEFYGQLNMMKGGLLFADRVTTVSPRYAREIQTPEFGCGLDGVVQTRAGDIVGLLNGIDPAIWNPACDGHLPAPFSAADLTGKKVCRAELLRRHGFDPRFAGPVFGMVCRFTEQKGVDLVLANADFFRTAHARLILLGTGDPRLVAQVRELAASAPDRVAVTVRQDESMSHLVEAGSDFFLMPSKFEPCGLNQMYSLRYGTVPIVRAVGGLDDTVRNWDAVSQSGNGFKFREFRSDKLMEKIYEARFAYTDKESWAQIQRNGMTVDNSWENAAKNYQDLYRLTLSR